MPEAPKVASGCLGEVGKSASEERALSHPSKIATCCYCGARAALMLAGDIRHELACSSCGAPLHNLKQMPMPAAGKAPAHFSHPIRTPKSKGKAGHKSAKKSKNSQHGDPSSKRKKPMKKRSKWAKDLIEDVFDVIEDIFD